MILQLLLFILLFLVILVLMAAMALRGLYYRSGLKKALDALRGQAAGASPSDRNRNDGGRHHRRAGKTPSGDVIIDHRDPEKAQQKIFGKDEGEYVDYEETK